MPHILFSLIRKTNFPACFSKYDDSVNMISEHTQNSKLSNNQFARYA